MLPAPKSDRLTLADVLPSCVSALRGEPNRLGLGRAAKVIVVVVDGLGAAAIRARAGHARTLAASLSSRNSIESGFPTTTAAALATLTTGAAPGRHGLVGYTALDPAHDRVVNQLTGWDADLDPATWQRVATVFETSSRLGVASSAIGPARYRDSGFTHAVLRGAEYVVAGSIDERFERALEHSRAPGAELVYVYVPELDMAAHASGWESSEWTERLETVDSALRTLLGAVRKDVGVIVTADHGVIDIPARSHILIDEAPGLVDGVRHVAGDPRCLQLHFEPELSVGQRAALIDRWRNSEDDRAWVATRAEAIEANWFGVVDAAVEPRIGDLLVAARKNIAYYDSRSASPQGRAMIGQHGSWSSAEVTVPLLRLAAFA